MSRRQPPAPMCACGHPLGLHPNATACTHREVPDEPDTRCGCGKFAVPKGPGNRKPGHRAPAAKKKGTPWWR